MAEREGTRLFGTHGLMGLSLNVSMSLISKLVAVRDAWDENKYSK